MEEPVKKFFRLFPGGEVRLKGAYIIRCDEFVKDQDGKVVELRCTVDLDSRSGSEGASRKVKGTLHWVNAADAVPVAARLYEPLLADENDQEEEDDEAGEKAAPAKKDFISRLNKNSLVEAKGFAEPALDSAEAGATFQFLRLGYFCKDSDSAAGKPVYNRTVTLKDSWAKANR